MRAALLLVAATMGAQDEGFEFDLAACEALEENETAEADALAAIGGTPVDERRLPDGAVIVTWRYRKAVRVGFWGGTARVLSWVPLVGIPFRSYRRAATRTGALSECVVTFREGTVETFTYRRGREHRGSVGGF